MVEIRPRGVVQPGGGLVVLIYAASWLAHALVFRGQYNVILTGGSGTATRSGFVRREVLDTLQLAAASHRAAQVAHRIEKGHFDPWGPKTPPSE
ncbi:MAG: hypothetical protein KY439_12385 [Actinobacteria bacterium]|nr:hypothetical protein [Actinomycetota bacterium]